MFCGSGSMPRNVHVFLLILKLSGSTASVSDASSWYLLPSGDGDSVMSIDGSMQLDGNPISINIVDEYFDDGDLLPFFVVGDADNPILPDLTSPLGNSITTPVPFAKLYDTLENLAPGRFTPGVETSLLHETQSVYIDQEFQQEISEVISDILKETPENIDPHETVPTPTELPQHFPSAEIPELQKLITDQPNFRGAQPGGSAVRALWKYILFGPMPFPPQKASLTNPQDDHT